MFRHLLPLTSMRNSFEVKPFRNTISPTIAEILHKYRKNYHTNKYIHILNTRLSELDT
jgi:hypothetical protein